MTTSKLDQAREWARDNIDDFYEGERGHAVCEVIQSLPDQWIDAEKVRELKLPKDSDSTSVNGAVTRDSPLSERLDSLFGYDPTGEDPQSPLGPEGHPHSIGGSMTNTPFTETWYCARYDDGRPVEDINFGYTATDDPESISEAVTDYGDEPATLYRAVVTWEPVERLTPRGEES